MKVGKDINSLPNLPNEPATGKITVTDSKKNILFEKNVTSEQEIREFFKKAHKGSGGGVLMGMFVPLRTRKSKVVADTLVPLTSRCYKIVSTELDFKNHKVVSGIFAGLAGICGAGTLALDLLTLPFRVITLPFRAAYNWNHRDNPIAKEIQTEANEERLKKVGRIQIQAELVEPKHHEGNETIKKVSKFSTQANIRPVGLGHDPFESTEDDSYIPTYETREFIKTESSGKTTILKPNDQVQVES